VSEVRQQGLIGAPRRGPFVDAAAGMNPSTTGMGGFDTVAGKRHWRGWLSEWFEALEQVARTRSGDAAR
jgi:hypothetical protein